MFKFNDTQILGEVQLATGSYVLAFSENCGEAYDLGYTLRYYEAAANVQPWIMQADDYADFASIEEGIGFVADFPAEDRQALTLWLHEFQVDAPQEA